MRLLLVLLNFLFHLAVVITFIAAYVVAGKVLRIVGVQKIVLDTLFLGGYSAFFLSRIIGIIKERIREWGG